MRSTHSRRPAAGKSRVPRLRAHLRRTPGHATVKTDFSTLMHPFRKPQVRYRYGGYVMIESPDQQKLEVYRVGADGQETFVGYMHEQPQAKRAQLMRAWMAAHAKQKRSRR